MSTNNLRLWCNLWRTAHSTTILSVEVLEWNAHTHTQTRIECFGEIPLYQSKHSLDQWGMLTSHCAVGYMGDAGTCNTDTLWLLAEFFLSLKMATHAHAFESEMENLKTEWINLTCQHTPLASRIPSTHWTAARKQTPCSLALAVEWKDVYTVTTCIKIPSLHLLSLAQR